MSERLLTLLPNGHAGLADVEWTLAGPRLTPVAEGEGKPEGVLTPGFVDIHIHGGFGVDFMTSSPSAISEWAEKLSDEGYEAFLPTTVTASAEAVKDALGRLPEHPLIKGVHLEGPFISPEFPGAQPPQFILDPAPLSSAWQEIINDPRIKVMTLAPERPGGLDLVRLLSAKGIILSLGHTNGAFEEAQAGFKAGVRHSTHTYNAMKGLHHRDAGTVGFVLSEPGMTAELIYDRFHVSFGAAQALLQAKGLGGVIAVSDGTQAAGMPDGTEFAMWDHKVILKEGQVRLASNGALAGSAITLKDAFINLAQDFGLEAAIRACCLNPRRALKMTDPPRAWVKFSPDFSEHQVIRC